MRADISARASGAEGISAVAGAGSEQLGNSREETLGGWQDVIN